MFIHTATLFLYHIATSNTFFSDPSVVYTKLNTFLDSFQDSFKDFAPGGTQGNEVSPGTSIDVDSVFGDCKDILLNLLDLVERVERYCSPVHPHPTPAHFYLARTKTVNLH